MSVKGKILVGVFILMAVLTAVLFFMLEGREKYGVYYTTQYQVFGTELMIRLVYGEDKTEEQAEAAAMKVTEMLREAEADLSANFVRYPDGDVVRFNRLSQGERTEVSEITARLFEICSMLYRDTEGAFNPAVYHAVRYWGFGEAYGYEDEMVPQSERKGSEAALLLPLSDFNKAELIEEDGKYYLVKNCASIIFRGTELNMCIDFGGAGKGFALDEAKKYLAEEGFGMGYMSLGYSSIILLDAPDNNTGWEIGLINPRYAEGGEYNYAGCFVKNNAFSTSGDYQRYYIEDGIRYCHIIDKELSPVSNGYIACSVITKEASCGDIISTSLMVLGDKASDFVAEYGEKYGIEGYLLVKEGSGGYLVTDRIGVTIYDDEFKVI